jgi:hypothetical protein
VYKRTQIPLYLDTARRLADFFISALPEDGIVPWDFDAPKPASADSSAAALVSNGLLLLASLETDGQRKETYTEAASKVSNPIFLFPSI